MVYATSYLFLNLLNQTNENVEMRKIDSNQENYPVTFRVYDCEKICFVHVKQIVWKNSSEKTTKMMNAIFWTCTCGDDHVL